MRVSCVLIVAALLAGVFGSGKTSHKVKKLPGQEKESTFAQYTGYVQVNATTDANLFYWFVGSQRSSSDPFVLWLTGGPGCSAELALLFENGPWSVDSNMKLVDNPYSWNTVANVLYVDSPAGTGYSYVTNPQGYVTNEAEMADNLYTVLQAFFSMYPEYQQNAFFIFGESYAGHYVPAISERILHGNKKRGNIDINFKGLAIGNGMSMPLKQYGEYAPFSLSHGLISAQVKSQLDATYAQCKSLLQQGSPAAVDVCQSIPGTIQNAGGNFNVYDVTKTCDGPLCYNMTAMTMYLNQPAVMQALGVRTSQWTACNDTVYAAIATPDWFNQEAYTIPVLLDYYRVMIYAGVEDWICNHQGNYKWVSELSWNGSPEFANATRLPWLNSATGHIDGYEQSSGNLRFVAVNNAGHMVCNPLPLREIFPF